MSNQRTNPASIFLPKNTTIINGTFYYKNENNINSINVGPLTSEELNNDYGILIENYNSTYERFEEIELTDFSITTGNNSIVYQDQSISYIKFDVKYPNGDIKTMIFRLRFSNVS